MLLQTKQCFVIDAQSGYERLYAFLTGQHCARFPERSAGLRTVAQETIEPLFAIPGKASFLVPDKPIPVANARLTLKPDIPPAPRQDIRGLDWYDECDAAHFMGRSEDPDRILAMLLSRPIIRLQDQEAQTISFSCAEEEGSKSGKTGSRFPVNSPEHSSREKSDAFLLRVGERGPMMPVWRDANG